MTNTTDTQATFPGKWGSTYAFKVQARANVGNLEPLHQQPDATTHVGFIRLALATVSGTVTLEGCENPAQSLTFEFRPTNGRPSFTRTQTLTSTGGFLLGGIPVGTYQLAIKGSKWLRKDMPIDATNGNVSNLNVTLSAGDCNDDNSVDIFDIGVLFLAFDTQPGDPDYDERADLNSDGSVDIFDFSLLALNFDTEGDP